MLCGMNKNFKNGITPIMSHKNVIYILTAFLLFIQTNYAQQKLSIRDAVVKALNNNTSILKSANNLDVSKEAIKTANANLLPTVGISGGYNWQKTEGKNNPSSSGDNGRWSLGVGGSVDLFDGLANYSGIKQKENTFSAAQYDYEKLKQDVALQAITMYLAIVSDKKLLDFQREDLKYNQALAEKIKQMYEIKAVALTDVYSQSAQTANSELTALQAENNYEKSQIALLNYLALDVSGTYTFSLDSADINDTTGIPNVLSELIATAQANRQDYKSAAFKVRAAENLLQVANGSLYPKVTGSYDVSTGASVLGDLFSQRTYSAGLSVSLPIFSQYSIEASIQSADVQLKNQREDLSALERQIKTDVKNSFLDVETAKKQFDVSKKALESAELSWRAKKETYTLGAASYLELQLSYNNYLQAEYTVISKEYSYINSQFALLAAIGKLNR